MPGICKIGFTTRSPYERLAELNEPSSVPVPFELALSIPVHHAAKAEKILQEIMTEKRVSNNREFFHGGAEDLISEVYAILDEQNIIDYTISPFPVSASEKVKSLEGVIEILSEFYERTTREATRENANLNIKIAELNELIKNNDNNISALNKQISIEERRVREMYSIKALWKERGETIDKLEYEVRELKKALVRVLENVNNKDAIGVLLWDRIKKIQKSLNDE